MIFLDKISFLRPSSKKAENKQEKQATNTFKKEDETNLAKVPSEVALSYIGVSPVSRSSVLKQLKLIKNSMGDIFFNYQPTINAVIDNIDLKNPNPHLANIKFCASKDYLNIETIAKNGYFASDEGLNAFEIAKKYFSPERDKNSNLQAPLNIALSQIKAKDWETISKRNIPSLRGSGNLDNFKQLASLNDEEFARTTSSPYFSYGLNYVSDNDDINEAFKIKHQQGKRCSIVKDYKKLEQLFKTAGSNNPKEIKALTTKFIDNFKNEYFGKFVDEIISGGKEISPEDFKFYIENIETIHNLIHQAIPNFDDKGFMITFSSIASKVKECNFEVFKKALQVKPSISTLSDIAFMLKDEKATENLSEVFDKILAGELDKTYIPKSINGKINPRVEEGLTYKYFGENENSDSILRKTSQGDICFIGDKTYINHNQKLEELKISKKMFEKLFPQDKALVFQQANNIGDCYFLSGGLYNFMKDENLRKELLSSIEQVGDDILVRYKGLKKYPILFKNAQLNNSNTHLASCLGNQILEEAYIMAKAGYKNKGTTNYSNAISLTYGGREIDAYKDIMPDISATEYNTEKYASNKNSVLISKEKLEKLLDKYSKMDRVILSCGTYSQDEGTLKEYGIYPAHAYGIEKIDSENRTVTIVNPSNTLFKTTISYEQFIDKFRTFAVGEY